MADSDHLEKMGRELKCPICLSLLNSAVSLTCNHVFCNLCILKSMKSDSSCPVCKVPYQRREVRPAPHMDNLVNIYKSMEVASGTNIFITQTALSTKISDGQNLAKCESNPATLETGRISTGKQKKQKKFKGKGSKELVKIDAKTSAPHLVKPSFPAKKRIQVPQYPLSDTPKHPEKCEVGRLGETVEVEPKDASTVPKEKLAFNEHGHGEPMFSPFFWLREDDDDDGDAEKSSEQQMECDLVMDTPTPNALCFSDIKSTDNESPNKTPLAEEVCSESRVADVFDTEMFEWTQRACSPELCSTPMKNQVGSKDELDGIQEKVYEAASHIWTASTNEGELVSEGEKSMNAKQRTNNTDVELHMSSSSNTINARDHNETNKSSKRGKQGSRRSQRKRVKLSIDEALEEVLTDLNLGRKCANSSNALNLGKGNIKRGKKTLNSTAMNTVQDDVPSKSVEAKIHIQGNENVSKELLASACEEPNHDETLNLKYKTSKSIEKINGHSVKNCSKRSKIQNFDIAEANVLKEVSLNENQENENMDIGIPLLTSPRADDSKTSDSGMKTSRRAKRIKTQVKRELRNQKRLKLTDYNGKDGLLDPVLDGSSETPRKEAQTSKDLQENVEIKLTDKSKITEKILHVAKGRILHKCEGVLTQIRCAFCQSSEDSEASGEMVHYLKGRPVDADYNRESNIIHSHRNCTEWAPNVYFEEDTAINIETELARSRRIKCCCCGMKGAALGCYEKSCHKSFHVPCAKLVPQCRWDTENFVILCPLHSSSKLPNEISGSQGKSRKRSIPKVGSQAQQVVKHDFSTTLSWKCSGSHNKWVLCCSAITMAEKEIVAEFARLAGVSMTKTWGPNVTHVIASVDENGACKRTFKFLMGILEGKWILKIDWIKACMKAMKPVGEEPYEISVDIHGIRDGPHLGRLRVLNKQPKLFNEFKFYFTGEFMSSYKGYLQDLVVAAGGTVLQRKPILCDQGRRLVGSSKEKTFIVYSLELPNKGDSGKKMVIHNRRQNDAEALAKSTGAQAVGHSWIMDSIAACKLQKLV